MAARTGREPSAERRELERLREVAQRVAVGPQLVFEDGTERAPLYARGARDGIDLEHAIERGEVDARHAGIRVAHQPGLDTTHHRRPAAVRNGRHIGARTPVEQRDDLVLVAREGDDVGGRVELTTKTAHDVAVRLAVGVRRAIEEVGRSDRGERRRWAHARGPQLDGGQVGRRADLDVGPPESFADGATEPAHAVGRKRLVLPAPAPPRPSSARFRDRRHGPQATPATTVQPVARTLYDVLGVTPTADAEALRRACLSRARESHPDRYIDAPPADRNDAERRMRDVNEA